MPVSSPSLAAPGDADARPTAASFALALALAAVALPTLIAFNLPPSATFFNQAVGWGAWVVRLGSCQRSV